jgi:hypothetical protein
MKYAKNEADPQERAASLTARTFVRAAWFSTLLVGGVVSIYYVSTAVHYRDVRLPLIMGLVRISLITLAIWMIAGLLGTLLLVARLLWTNRRNRVPKTGFDKAAPSSVWDDWLDGPS